MKSNKSIFGFDWDEGNIQHISRHDVKLQEAEELFFDEDTVVSEALKHSGKEKRYIIVGKTKRDRLLYQVFTVRENKIRIISSRDLNKKEVYLYEKKTNRS